MRVLTINNFDLNHVLAVNLIGIFLKLEPYLKNTQWETIALDFLGNIEEELFLADQEERLSSNQLIKLLSLIDQVIEGEFRGYFPDQKHPWIITRVIDSSAYEIETNHAEVASMLGRSFQTSSRNTSSASLEVAV
jgi:hypothetical protein